MIPPQWTHRVGVLLLAAAGLFLGLCLLTYHPADTPLLSSHPQHPPANVGGATGTWVGLMGRGAFGWAAFFFPLWCFVWAWRLWRGHRSEIHAASLMVAVVCLMAGLGTLLGLRGADPTAKTALGGVVGFLLSRAGTYYIGSLGTVLAAGCVVVLSWVVVSGQTLRATGIGFVWRFASAMASRWRQVGAIPELVSAASKGARTASEPKPPMVRDTGGAAGEPAPADVAEPPRVKIRSMIAPKSKAVSSPPRAVAPGGFRSPSLDTLTIPPPTSARQMTDDRKTHAKVLVETLRDFGVEASVVNIDQGPTITRYELKPAPGVKLTKIASLADELALVLKAVSCNVVAPIPGKGLVGIDVPNTKTTIVYLREVLASPEFENAKSPLALPLGKDVSGRPIVVDLRDFPHLLIAGATGSGKTVCLNSLLVGILSHTTPEQVQFLMIDPKMVELAVFNGIPHLITPVVTDSKKAAAALGWAVQEMERRYEVFASAGVRNLQGYNEWVAKGGRPSEGSGSENAGRTESRALPYLAIIIDELADLMMASSQEVEAAITRLAQLSRAVGIHIILATQRPSVDVITGVIKANFPARLAFQVASKVDSRTILDMNGADKLLGRGDLLFLRPGAAKPIRAQGAFVTDAEIARVTSFLKEQGAPSYDEGLLEAQRRPAVTGPWGDEQKDELYELAKQTVLDNGQASTSLLQRRLRLGYGRAARLLDRMEQEGLIGPPQGSRPRELLAGRVETARRSAS